MNSDSRFKDASRRTFVVFVIHGALANAFRHAVIESPRVQAWLRRSFAAPLRGWAST